MNSKKEKNIVSKRILAVAFISPFLFSIGFMIVAYLATMNTTKIIRNISLIIATFVGIISSIGLIFFLQFKINKKMEKEIEA
ncbi:MAG: hypothetical protein ACTSSG_05795 [Candidatus Heimdallarchaeaceae archaeon]